MYCNVTTLITVFSAYHSNIHTLVKHNCCLELPFSRYNSVPHKFFKDDDAVPSFMSPGPGKNILPPQLTNTAGKLI